MKDSGPILGQRVWFLGYPFGDRSLTTAGEINGSHARIPFIKAATLSAIEQKPDGAVIYYLDGLNNVGFSGGPAVFWSFSERKCKLLSVISGYRREGASIVINGQEIPSTALVNAGIVISYGIHHALSAIDASKPAH